jgi:hypothetical protein
MMLPLRSLAPYGFAGAVVALGAGAYLWARSRRKTLEQLERERRQWITTNGRIIDGTVIDTHEFADATGEHQLVIYNYDVAGVQYEASQEVTWLRHLVDLHACRIGLPASVKYDPHNPANSIVVAEGWSGLRMVHPERAGVAKALSH